MARKLSAKSRPEADKPIDGDASAKKKRGRGAKAPEPAIAAATEEQKREAMDRLIDADKTRVTAKQKFDQATSSYRAIFKETCKITGFDKETMAWYMRSRGMEPHEIDAVVREQARIANFMGMGVGFQSAFDFAAQPAEDDSSDGALKAAQAQGYEAGATSDRPEANPYPDGSERNARWAIGYRQAQAKIAQGMNGKTPTHAEAHA